MGTATSTHDSNAFERLRRRIQANPFVAAAIFFVTVLVPTVAIFVNQATDLVARVSPKDLRFALDAEPFAGFQPVSAVNSTERIFTDGVNLTLVASSSGKSASESAITRIALSARYKPGRDNHLSYTYPESSIRPLGPLQPLSFDVNATGEILEIDWIGPEGRRQPTEASNVLRLANHELLSRAVEGGKNEVFTFRIKPSRIGLYRFSISVGYVIDGKAIEKELSPILVYAEN
jgi:hypothetical protein